MTLTGAQTTAKTLVEQLKADLKAEPFKEPKTKKDDFYTGVLSRGTDNVLGQCTRKVYLNEFIDFWKDDYRAKIKCACFLGVAIFTFNVFAPFSLFCVALAAKYWDHAMWCRNIARFNGNFRTAIIGE
ncbi:MAG: hypothetical protein V1722_02875 [Candidatus Micrarchaeota archaeon]